MSYVNESVRIISKEIIAPHVYRFSFEAPLIASVANPGQFLMVKPSSGYEPLLRRPFSISSLIADSVIQIIVKVVGKGTRAICQKTEGDSLEVLGPLGKGFSLDGGRFLLVGGGIGVAPLFFTAQRLRAKQIQSIAIIGARSRDELLGEEEFRALDIPVYKATEDGSAGHKGLVTDLVNNYVGGDRSWEILACGPQGMLKALSLLCHEKGWRCQVSLETYMACGIEACLGCAVATAERGGGYLHACKDGPVFYADQIKW